MLKKIFVFSVLFLLPFFGSFAQQKENGYFFDIHAAYNSIGSGFDGESALIALDDVFAVPNFSTGIGFGLAIGFRYEEGYIEFAFQRTQHDFIWTEIKGDAP